MEKCWKTSSFLVAKPSDGPWFCSALPCYIRHPSPLFPFHQNFPSFALFTRIPIRCPGFHSSIFAFSVRIIPDYTSGAGKVAIFGGFGVVPEYLGSEDCVLMKVEARFGEEEEEAKRAGGKRNGERLLKKQECGRRTRRRVQPTSTVIQRLFLACKKVFKGGSGTVPEPADVEMLQLLLGTGLQPPSIGLTCIISIEFSYSHSCSKSVFSIRVHI